ncbi:MAG TPA: hypothetical protein VM754_12170 [Actinomycetota bacterium]|nr:hypothetical protein [Actinomycetota bacterium]
MSFRKSRKSRKKHTIIGHGDQSLEARAMREATRAEEYASRVVHDAESSIAGPGRRPHIEPIIGPGGIQPIIGPGGTERPRHYRPGNATAAVEAAERMVHQAERTVEHAIAEGARHQDRAMHQAEEAMERAINEAQRQATRAVKVAEYAVSRDQ